MPVFGALTIFNLAKENSEQLNEAIGWHMLHARKRVRSAHRLKEVVVWPSEQSNEAELPPESREGSSQRTAAGTEIKLWHSIGCN